MSLHQAIVRVQRVETKAWAEPREGLTLDELVSRLAALGNTVIEIDRENNRVLVAHTVDGE